MAQSGLVVRVRGESFDPLVDVTNRHGVELTFFARARTEYRLAHLYHGGNTDFTLCGVRIGDDWLVPADGMRVCHRCESKARS